mgnify:CR=1 FL=1
MIHKVVANGKWTYFNDRQLVMWDKAGQHEIAQQWRDGLIDREKRPISFLLPHGAPWHDKPLVVGDGVATFPPSTYPKEWKNDGVAFLNSKEDIELLFAANQSGKTFLGAAWSCLHVVPCDPTWQIFTRHRVICPPWTGRKKWVVGSYSWDNVTTLWERYKYILPREELGRYAPDWGKFPGEKGMARGLSFGDGKPKRIALECGSELIMLCYTQLQMHWEGFESDGAHFDEQPPYEKWVGWNRGTTTRGDYTPCCFTLTPHVMEDRPDTGASGWVVRDLWKGGNTRGKTIGRYHIPIASVPDAIISKVKKHALWRQWADPAIERSEKDKRAAVARYWGGPEEGGGLVFDEWQREIHVINPLWSDDKTPKDCTLFRSIDYGEGGVACCAWFAVTRKGYAVCYRLLYQANMNLFTFVTKIIEMSRNEMVYDCDATDVMGNTFKVYREHMKGEVYFSTVMDRRSRNTMRNGESLGDLFSRYGLIVNEASAEHDSVQIPRLKEWLRIDMAVDHVQRKAPDGKPLKGAPRLYFFDGVCSKAVEEIESLAMDGETGKIDKKAATHFIDAAKYWASDRPQFWGNHTLPEEQDMDFEDTSGAGTPLQTGY